MNSPQIWGEIPGEARTYRALPFTGFDDIDIDVQKEWMLKGVCARGETMSLVGGPGQGKSALITDIAVHVAAGWDWRGHKAKGRWGVVYIAFERSDLLKRRLDAYRRKFMLSSLPIAVVSAAIDFMNPESIPTAVATIEAVSARFNETIGMVIVDTFAKAVAIGGGDENQAKDQGRFLSHLREIQNRTGVHFALIGHTGKDETRGARGSNAHLGDVDVMVVVTGEKVKEATVTKANDQAEGRLTTFTLESFEFGVDEDGDPITTSIVSADAPDRSGSTPVRRLSPKMIAALDALEEAIANFGQPAPAALHLPQGVRAVEASRWRDELCSRGVLDREDQHLRQAFYRLRTDMSGKHLIGSRDELVWRAA